MQTGEKLMELRRKQGWSQEELAERLGVSRQAVSKWESGQTLPDMDKVLLLSEIFSVSTDYLLKEDITVSEDGAPAGRLVTGEEAEAFLQVKAQTAGRIGLAAGACILSPVCLLLLAAGQSSGTFAISGGMAAGIGLAVLLVIVAAAVYCFISCGMKTRPFHSLDEEDIRLERGVADTVRQRQEAFAPAYGRQNAASACLCVVAAIPLLVAALQGDGEMLIVSALCVTLLLVAIAVYGFIRVGVVWHSMQTLLQEGEHTSGVKKNRRAIAVFSTAYWLVATAAFLILVEVDGGWQSIRFFWPVAGILFGAAMVVMAEVARRK